MLSLQLATVVPAPRLISPPKYSIKASGTAGKRTGEVCFSPASPMRKSCLAATSNSAAYAGTDDEESAIQLRPELMPKHVAIIMDGNGRWAKNRGLPVRHGHKAGSTSLTRVASECSELGIKALTLYTFSDENWKRSKMEIDFLMKAYEDYIRSEIKELITRYDIRFSVIGNKSKLPESLQATISWAEEISEDNKGMHFISALSYSGRNDIVEATKKIASKVEQGIVGANEIDETMFQQQLTTNITEFPNPDLLIRTSGELRISNFLLWQLAYTEFYFSDKLFPDFGEVDILEAITSYQRRQRRYGDRQN